MWNAVVAEFAAPDGSTFTRDIVRSPGAVAVVALLAAPSVPTVVLIAQYRPPFDEVVIEIPAGMCDVAGEALETTATRELAEEVGLRTDALQPLGSIYPSVGMTDSITTLFLAEHCTPVPRTPMGPEEAVADVLEVPLDEAVEWVLSGRVVDAKSVAGLLLAERRLRR